MSITTNVQAYLDTNKGDTFRAPVIAKALNLKTEQVAAALAGLVKDGRAVKVDKGVYAAATTDEQLVDGIEKAVEAGTMERFEPTTEDEAPRDESDTTPAPKLASVKSTEAKPAAAPKAEKPADGTPPEGGYLVGDKVKVVTWGNKVRRSDVGATFTITGFSRIGALRHSSSVAGGNPVLVGNVKLVKRPEAKAVDATATA